MSGAPRSRQTSCSFWSTRRHGRLQAASRRPIWEPCQWSRGLERPQHSSNRKQAVAVRPTTTESTAGRPGTGDYRRPNRDREEAHKRPHLRQKDGKHSAARGAGNPRGGADPRGGSQGQGSSGEGPAWTHYVHRRVANGGRSCRLCGGRKKGESWKGIKTHMGYNQEAYDVECAALARALEEASRRNTSPERVTIFSDAQAAIRRMASDEPGPG